MRKNIDLILNTNADKKIQKNSILTYSQRLEWIKKKLKIKTDDIGSLLENDKKIIETIEASDLKVSTKKLTFIVLANLSKKLKLEKEYNNYNEQATKYKDQDNFIRRENKVSDDRKDKWASWKEIESVFDMIDETKDWKNAQDKLIVGLYTLCEYTLRLDWADVKIESKYNKNRKYNYVVIDSKGDYNFYLNVYKTQSKYGSIKIKLDNPKLKKLLDYWFDTYKYKYLLVSYKDSSNPLNEMGLSKRIQLIFNKYLNKPISNQILREIKESQNIYGDKNYANMTLNEKYALHSKLLHSFSTANEYSKRDPNEVIEQ